MGWHKTFQKTHLPKDCLEDLKSRLELLGATIVCELYTNNDNGAVAGLEVRFDPPLHTMPRKELELFDPAARWRKVLRVCLEHGLTPEPT